MNFEFWGVTKSDKNATIFVTGVVKIGPILARFLQDFGKNFYMCGACRGAFKYNGNSRAEFRFCCLSIWPVKIALYPIFYYVEKSQKKSQKSLVLLVKKCIFAIVIYHKNGAKPMGYAC